MKITMIEANLTAAGFLEAAQGGEERVEVEVEGLGEDPGAVLQEDKNLIERLARYFEVYRMIRR